MRIGVLGAGQLGRMLALAGIPLGLEFVFYDHNPKACAAGLGDFICGEFEDTAQLARFAAQIDIATLEFENIPLTALEQVARQVPVYPAPLAVGVAQDRLQEKTLFSRLDIPVPRYAAVDNAAQLHQAATEIGGNLIVKSRRLGYDGKGQATLSDPSQSEAVFASLGSVPMLAEQQVRFGREVSLIAVRNAHDVIRFYPLTENVHQHGILRRSQPRIDDALQDIAQDYASRVLRELDYVGVLAFEFFDCDGELMANEIAPRVHNSGHWTIEGAITSQFENHLRAILDWPLGDTDSRINVVMYNLIGALPERNALLALRGAHVHDYGKEPRAGRKVGHVTLCNPTPEAIARLEASIQSG